MQFNRLLKLIPITFVAAGLFLGCGEATEHTHDHDDGHNHEGHDHGDGKQVAVSNDDGYPMTTCLVEGSKLGSMGKPFVHVYKGVTVKFCCEGCLEDFNKEPEKYLAKLEAAKKTQPEATDEKSGGDKGEKN
jgi:YHS domain-containing protein